MRYAYPATVERTDDGFYLVLFPDVLEAGADGRTREEALHEASVTLGAALAGYVKEGRALPRPSEPRPGQRVVPVPVQVAASLALRGAMRAQGITNVELGRRLGINERAVRRLVDPDHHSTIERLSRALAVVEHDLVVEDCQHTDAA